MVAMVAMLREYTDNDSRQIICRTRGPGVASGVPIRPLVYHSRKERKAE